MPPLLSKEEMVAVDSGDESDNEPMSTDILEDIRDGSKYHLNVIKYVILLRKDNRNGKGH